MGEVKDFPGASTGRITTIPVDGGTINIIHDADELTKDKALDILRKALWKINSSWGHL